MKRILKIGDVIYGVSLQNINNSYFEGFPQREQYLLKFAKNTDLSFFRHKVLDNLDIIFEEKSKLTNFLKDKKFDYIVIDNPLSSLIIEDNVKIPIVFDCIDWYDEMYLREFGVNRRYYLLRYGYLSLLNRAQKVIAQSPIILKTLQNWGLKTNDSIIIPNGYDKDIFYPYSEAQNKIFRKKLEKKYSVKIEDKKIIVYTGKVGLWYDQLLNIVSCLSEEYLFFIVGDGPLLNKISNKKNIIKCGREDIENIPKYTNIADILVFPVGEDCSPIAISEYLAIGKPIVMPFGRMGWLLKDMINVCFVEKNITSWRQGIENANKLKASAYKNNIQLAKELSWQKLSNQFYNFLNN